MYYSTSRVLAVLELLQAHGQMRAEDIAQRLEVDVRTVRRYVMILRDQGIPVDMKRGRYGGYSLPQGFRAPLALTKEEALALAYGLLSGGQRSPGRAASESERALTKVTRALPASTRDLIRRMDGAVTFATPVIAGIDPVTPDYLEVVVNAIQSRHRVSVRYRAGSGHVTDRAVDPYQVVHRYGRWYLVGYCHLRAGQRVFRLDHVLRAAPLLDTFSPPALDALAAVEQAIAQTPWRWEYRVVVALSHEALSQRIPPTMALLHPHERGTLLHGFAYDLDYLAYTLAGLGCPLVILEPPELRARMLALADRIRAIAETSAPGAES
ncbi:MAG TPA: YafY family protein [Ktedonobacterales bacterium]|nr:YafY family protein [Ktedonobacterales bacterium]